MMNRFVFPSTLGPRRQVGWPAILALLVILAVALPVAPAWAQGEPEAAKPAGETLRDPLGRDTPEGMVNGLVRAMAGQDYTRAAQYLDLSSWRARRGQTGEQMVQKLQKLLDQGGWLEANWKMSGAPEGRLDDGLPPDQDQFARVRTPDGTVELLARRVERPDGTRIWLVSGDTVAQIPRLLDSVDVGLLERVLPEGWSDGPRLGGVSLADWGALVLLALLAYGLAVLLTGLARHLARRLWRRHPLSLRRRLVDAAVSPLRICLAVWLFAFGGIHLGVSVVARQSLGLAAEMVGWVGLAWFLWRIVDTIGAASLDRTARRGEMGALALIRFLRRLVKLLVLGGASIILLDALGFDVSAGLAALGIGGLAIALGAQKTFENLVGSLMLLADRPVHEGDFCRFGTVTGTVEDIGMRSTRIRTLDRTVVTVPNGELSSLSIENYTARDRFWFHPTLSLRYSTKLEQVRHLLVTLREMLYAHPRVDPDPARVRFVGFGESSIRIEIFAYVHAADYSEFLEVQEDLWLRIMDLVEASGTSFACPSRTLYLARDGADDPARGEDAAAAVRAWREAGDLPLPRFPEERIAALKGTLPYPPPGAAAS